MTEAPGQSVQARPMVEPWVTPHLCACRCCVFNHASTGALNLVAEVQFTARMFTWSAEVQGRRRVGTR